MAGRIRTIKPEWLQDERLGALSDEARLLSVALILLADDWGNGRAAAPFLVGQAWGYAADGYSALDRCSRGLEELASIDFIEFYEHRGQRYFHVRKWFEHQKVDKPSRPFCPVPAWVVNDLPDRWREKWAEVRDRYDVQTIDAARIPNEPKLQAVSGIRADGTSGARAGHEPGTSGARAAHEPGTSRARAESSHESDRPAPASNRAEPKAVSGIRADGTSPARAAHEPGTTDQYQYLDLDLDQEAAARRAQAHVPARTHEARTEPSDRGGGGKIENKGSPIVDAPESGGRAGGPQRLSDVLDGLDVRAALSKADRGRSRPGAGASRRRPPEHVAEARDFLWRLLGRSWQELTSGRPIPPGDRAAVDEAAGFLWTAAAGGEDRPGDGRRFAELASACVRRWIADPWVRENLPRRPGGNFRARVGELLAEIDPAAAPDPATVERLDPWSSWLRVGGEIRKRIQAQKRAATTSEAYDEADAQQALLDRCATLCGERRKATGDDAEGGRAALALARELGLLEGEGVAA